MKLRIYIGLLLMIICFTTCKNVADERDFATLREETKKNPSLTLTPAEYVSWVRDKENHLYKEKGIEEIVFTSLFKPYNYIVCSEQRTPEIKNETLRESVKQLKGMIYFDLRIALEKGEGELLKYKLSSPEEYGKRVEYFAFKMQNDVNLVSGTDTIPCSLYHFERTYDVAPFSTLVLGFDVKNIDKDFSLVFNDKIFNKGIIRFYYTKEELVNVPKLKTI